MAFGKSFLIQLHSVQPGSDLEPGTVFPTVPERVVIGRGRDCDIVLADPSVSSTHVVLEASPEGFFLNNQTRNGTTFVNQKEVAKAASVEVRERVSWLQVGRALLKVVLVADTIPVSKALPVPMSSAADADGPAFLSVKLSARAPRVRLKGKPVSLFPSAARALGRLAATPGEVVDQDDLLTAMDEDFADRAGGLNLNQTITYVRRLFIEALDGGDVEAHELRQYIESCPGYSGEPLPVDIASKALCRELVANVRGVGYVLMLPASAVQTERR